MQDPLESYVSKLLKEKGVSETAEARQELQKKINEYIDQSLLGALPLTQLDELEKAAKDEQVDDGMVERLLSEAGTDPSAVIKKALETFRENYLRGDKK